MSRYGLQPAAFPDVEAFGFRGIKTEDVVDTAQAATIQNHINTISARTTIKIPQNTPIDQQRQLTDLFCKYQLSPTAGASTHPATDAFRRMCDNYVVDSYGANDIVEVGPSLSKLATQPRLFPGHACSPTLDNRDRARALQCRFKIAPNHPHHQTLIARSATQYPNPAIMCDLPSQRCQVQLPVLYSSYSLQDCTPTDLVAMMRAHGAHVAIVALSLPIPLKFVRAYHDSDTGARWERTGKGRATCHAGVGDAGYEHSIATLNSWTDGLTGIPLFGEVLKQYGSNFLFCFTLNDDSAGCEAYPMLIASTLAKYALIPNNIGAEHDFLTSSSHFERLVSYLTIHHSKFSQNLFKAALERISVLTPAIVLGSTKHTNRWVVTADERIDIAIAACHDVQRALHRAELANELVNINNTQLATDARAAKRSLTPGLLDRITAALRGEKSLEIDFGVLDNIATALDGGRNAGQLRTLGALPDTLKINNGSSGLREAQPAARTPSPPPPPPPPAAQPHQPERNGFPAPAAWHPTHDQVWAEALQGLPAARGARLLNAHDPATEHQAAINGHLARPVDGLSQVHRTALDNCAWAVDSAMALMLVGPPGTGKTTVANRICPDGTVVIVPTDQLASQWRVRRPAATILTLDAAMTQPRVLRTAPCILVDEANKFPAAYVTTYCTFGVPVVGLLDIGQGQYHGHLGAAAGVDNIPVDHVAVFNNLYRGGDDVRQFLSDRLARHYRATFNLPPAWDFVCHHPGLASFQRVIANMNGHHLACHRANTSIIAGCTTVGSSQGAEWPHVYLHLFDGDEAYFRQNPGELIVAVTRATRTMTITVPQRGARGLVQYLNGLRLPYCHRPNGTVFGSAHPVLDLPTDERELPGAFPSEDTLGAHELVSSGLESRGLDVHTVDFPPCPINIAAVLELAATSPPNPADLTNVEEDIKFRRPDGRIRGHVDEWEPTRVFQEPTCLPHVGYPFSNSEQLSSIYAIFDRYLKPQNVTISNIDACNTAEFMFNSWVDAFIDPAAVVTLPSTNDLLAHWLSKRTAVELCAIDESALRADTAGLFLSTYFLKAQAKPKFGAYGHSMECGQGIIAMEKLINASECPLLIGAVKTMQRMFKSNVVYDSGYSTSELDDAVSGILGDSDMGCLSIDLSQQDSSHMLVHRLFIAKVLRFLGFSDVVSSAYLISREMRAVKGMTLNVLFTVIERLFSGEPGTAFFNFLMSSGTTACTYDLRSFRLFLGKGDDNTVVPAPHRRSTAAQVIRRTGVIQKTERLPYLDFANRIWTTTHRSFGDPLRLLSKYTCRLTSRDNTDNEFTAWVDYDFTPSALESLEITEALALKHALEWCDASDIVTCAHALNDRATYMSMLRPGKLPASELPVLRHCCGHAVVFEDLEDRCGPEAVAFLADVPVADVIGQLATIRLACGVPPEVLDRARHSAHPDHAFVTRSEVVALARHYQFSLANGRDGLRLHLCREHISVVLVNDQRSAVRSFCPVFGSRSNTIFLWLVERAWALLWAVIRWAVLVLPGLLNESWLIIAAMTFGPWLYLWLCQRVDSFGSRVRSGRLIPDAVHLRHQPLVYGSATFSRRHAVTTLGFQALLLAVTLCLGLIAVNQLTLLAMVLPDVLAVLGSEVPVVGFVLEVLFLAWESTITVNSFVNMMVVGWTFASLRHWVRLSVLAGALSLTAVFLSWLGARFGFAVDALANWSGLAGLCLGICCAGLPWPWQLLALRWFGNWFHYCLLWSIVFLAKLNYMLLLLRLRLSRADHSGETPKFDQQACRTRVDALLRRCLTTVVRERGRAAREYFRACHPDKLRRIYPKGLVDAIETQLGSGTHPARHRTHVHHACPPEGPPVQKPARPADPLPPRQLPPAPPASPSPPSPPPPGVAPSSPPRPPLPPSRAPTFDDFPSAALVLACLSLAAGLAWLGYYLGARRTHARFAAWDELLAHLTPSELIPARQIASRPPRPYQHVPAPAIRPIRGLLTWHDVRCPVPAYTEIRHGSTGAGYTATTRLQDAIGFGQILPNPTPDWAFGAVRRDLITRAPGEDPLLRSQWTVLLASVRRAHGDVRRCDHLARRRILANVPPISRVGANEIADVCRLVLGCATSPDRDICRAQVLADCAVVGFAEMHLVNLLEPDQRLYRTTYLDIGECAPVTLTIMGAAASGKTTTYLRLLPDFARTLVVAISNELRDELERKLDQRQHNHVDVVTPHRPLLDGVPPRSYDLVIIDEVWALPRPLIHQLAALGKCCLAAGDPTQITDLGLTGQAMPFHTGCSQYTVVADFSYTMPQDIASFLVTCGRLPVDFICLSPVINSVHVEFDAADVPPGAEFRTIARQCGPTIHTFQGQRVRCLHAHVCALDAPLFNFSGAQGHGTTLLTRHTDDLYLTMTDRIAEQFNANLRNIATRGGF